MPFLKVLWRNLLRSGPTAQPPKMLENLLKLRYHAGAQEDAGLFDFCTQYYQRSKAQLLQDLFVLHHLKEMRRGYFVEFGAGDGVHLSNTYLLDKEYGWTGILAEPAQGWQAGLRANRQCAIDRRCVWTRTGEQLEFNETALLDLSTLQRFSETDGHAQARRNGKTYTVETISLNDLLAVHGAPRRIDYLSIDTEGSEYDILEAFDFSQYDIGVLTVEHNYTGQRDKLYRLLTCHGFTRVHETLSRWDDWYIRA